MRIASKAIAIVGGAGIIAAAIAAVAMPSRVSAMADIYWDSGLRGVYFQLTRPAADADADLAWPTAIPEEVGLSSERLEALRRRLAGRNSNGLIVARGGRMALEWYAPSYGPDRRHSMAALGKGAIASMVLLAALSDGLIGLDEPAALYIPEWAADPLKSRITLRHLVTHTSGLEDVSFEASQNGWKEAYLENDELRFRLAIEQAGVQFDPGSALAYSGIGFYVLAYAMGRALQASGDPRDIGSYLYDRILDPLGIPRNQVSISYRQGYEIDGMTLYALGSGGSATPRALARIGELLLRGGEWQGRQLLASEWIPQALTHGGFPPPSAKAPSEPATGLGWWVNTNGYFPSLPRDAAIAAGGGHQILLVVPSLHLVAVRVGGNLNGFLGRWDESLWASMDAEFFAPLMAAISNANPP